MEITLNKALELTQEYLQQKKYPEAIQILLQCHQQFRHSPALKSNLAIAYLEASSHLIKHNKLNEAFSLLKEAEATLPDNTSIIRKLSYVFALNNNIEEEIRNYEKALARLPQNHALQIDYGLSLLRLGDFKKGFQYYEARLINDVHTPHPDCIKQWDGLADLNNQSISIYYEQGYGDTIQFIRYLPYLKKQGASIHVFIPPELSSLLKKLPFVDVVVEPKQRAKSTDYFAYFASLPYLFKTDIDSIPANTPYLTTDPEIVARFKTLIVPTEKMKIGFCWAGNPKFARDPLRSMSLENAKPLLELKPFDFYNLTINKKIESQTHFHSMINLSPHLHDFMDTACLMQNLDLIITVDTAIAHLAGALNLPCWLMLEKTWPDWRWLKDRNDSPWYPSLKIYRQKQQGNWRHVIEQIRQDLQLLK